MSKPFPVHWTERALEDLSRILARIAEDKPGAASEIARETKRKTEQLGRFPFLGRPSAYKDVRELVIREQILVSYLPQETEVHIVQVWHTAQKRS